MFLVGASIKSYHSWIDPHCLCCYLLAPAWIWYYDWSINLWRYRQRCHIANYLPKPSITVLWVYFCTFLHHVYLYYIPREMAPNADHGGNCIHRLHRQLLDKHQVLRSSTNRQHCWSSQCWNYGQSIFSASSRRRCGYPDPSHLCPGSWRSCLLWRLTQRN